MQPIQGEARSVAQILKGARYSIDYYQREYQWETKQIAEMVSDLTSRFLSAYQPTHHRKEVANYPHYFLGSFIVSAKGSERYVVDGQQRLTSLTLLLIHLHRLAASRDDVSAVDDLIYSTKYGQKSFNINVPDRADCMTALFEGRDIDVEDASESVQNLVGRYEDITADFPDELAGDALPYFIDWLTDNVRLVEITAYNDDDAYSIFETMNDRGLKLTLSDMLRGYLLANIDSPEARASASETWKHHMQHLASFNQDEGPDFLKTWLRSQYANKIRERRRAAVPEDWDRIGTEFHRWLRERAQHIGLVTPQDFQKFLEQDFVFYSDWYAAALDAAASESMPAELQHVAYNADREFTLQFQLLLAPLAPGDSQAVARTKMELVARYVDITLARRIWNNKSIAYSTMSYAMFIAMRSIRRQPVASLAETLVRLLSEQSETFSTNDQLRLHQQNRYQLHRTLARISDYVAVASGEPSRYDELAGWGDVRHEVEHVWSNHFAQHTHEFQHEHDFSEHRNLVGDLLILPKSFNASYGAMSYDKKREHYLSQNLLARSLHEQAYEHNPGFRSFIRRTGLLFQPYTTFDADAVRERGELYRTISQLVWNPDDLLVVADACSA